MSTQPAAATPGAAAATHPAVLDAALQPTASVQALQAAVRIAARTNAQRAATVLPRTYKVRPGDTLSSIASRIYHQPKDWPALYWRNHRLLNGTDALSVGQVLRVPAKPGHIPAAPKQAGPAPSTPSPAQPASKAGAASSSGPYPGGAFGACVVARESGGNPQVMSASGYYGLYQFSEATWVAYGGNPADFGHASVAEQNQVFANALAAGGQSNWAPYDGC